MSDKPKPGDEFLTKKDREIAQAIADAVRGDKEANKKAEVLADIMVGLTTGKPSKTRREAKT